MTFRQTVKKVCEVVAAGTTYQDAAAQFTSEARKITAAQVSAWCYERGIRVLGGLRHTVKQQCVERLLDQLGPTKIARQCGCTRQYVHYVRNVAHPA